MRILEWAVVVSLAAARIAHADPSAEIAELVAKHVTAIQEADDKGFLATVTATAKVWKPGGYDYALPKPVDGCKKKVCSSYDNPRTIMYGHHDARPTFKLGKVIVQVEAANHVAWFEAPITGRVVWPGVRLGDEPPVPTIEKVQSRILGVAVDEGGWKIAAVTYAKPLPVSNQYGYSSPIVGTWTPPKPTITGDAAIANVAAAWFPSGLAAAKGSGEVVVASGTEPEEYATGAKVDALVATWDKRQAGPQRIDAMTFGDGSPALVTGIVQYPLPALQNVAPSAANVWFAAIAVPDGKTWRWVALQLSPVVNTL